MTASGASRGWLTRYRATTIGFIKVLRGAALVGAFLIGLVSGILGLALTDGPGRFGVLALRVIAVACGIYVVVGLAHALLIQQKRSLEAENRRLEGELEAAGQALRDVECKADLERSRYLGAVTRLVDRQTLLYKEDLELTIVIGDDDDSDEIVERHVTTPTPFLPYRSIRPLVPRELLVPPSFADLQVDVHVENRPGVMATVLPMVETGPWLRVLIIFEPPVDVPIIWTLCYRPHGMWMPLRRDGVDTLDWDTRSPLGRSDETTYTSFSIRFRYPSGNSMLRIRERANRGTVRRDGSAHEVVWSEENPQAAVYQWDLAMPHGNRRTAH